MMQAGHIPQTITMNPLSPQEVSSAMEHARQKATREGKRLTPLREHVYKLLLESPQPLGAYEILEKLDGVGAN